MYICYRILRSTLVRVGRVLSVVLCSLGDWIPRVLCSVRGDFSTIQRRGIQPKMTQANLDVILRKLEDMDGNICRNNQLLTDRMNRLEDSLERERAEIRRRMEELQAKVDDLENRERRSN